MIIDVTSFVLGVATGCLVLSALVFPLVGRVLVRSLAVVSLIAGIGMLTWTTIALYRGSELTPIVWQQVRISQPGEAFGWGAAFLSGGILVLTLSFAGHRVE